VKISSLRTPCVLIDQPTIDRMQQAAGAGGLRLQPHAKTHKRPDLALIPIARGAVGVRCAKLGEAEVFADQRSEDIRCVSNPADEVGVVDGDDVADRLPVAARGCIA
jgi:D-serine deaminase-like pyridoxal phosphate-dependent protein